VPKPFLKTATLRLLALSAALLAALGCVKDTGGGTTLYVYDNASSSVLVWNDVNKVYSAAKGATTVPAADRTIVNGLNPSDDLAWGGLAMDSTSNRLYLVTTIGQVYVINKASTQHGTVSALSDIISFNLGQSGVDPYSAGSVFEQAAVDGTSNTLFVLESAADGSATRVWRVTNASQMSNGAVLTPAAQYTVGISTDTFGCGVATIPGGNLYGLFGGGGTIYNGLGTIAYSGARLRQGSGGSFPSSLGNLYSSGVVVGALTELGSPQYGSLAYDSQKSALYTFAPSVASPTSSSILVFTTGSFSAGLNVAPSRTLAVPALPFNGGTSLRTISHPADGDWLLGTYFTLAPTTSVIGDGTGSTYLAIWDAPSGGGAGYTASIPGTTEIRGMAIGGTN
jgi:hypothetical protein